MFDLTQGSVGKTLTKMTTFTTLGMVSILGFALADAYYVGLLGKNYLASISYCVPALLFTTGIGVGLGIGSDLDHYHTVEPFPMRKLPTVESLLPTAHKIPRDSNVQYWAQTRIKNSLQNLLAMGWVIMAPTRIPLQMQPAVGFCTHSKCLHGYLEGKAPSNPKGQTGTHFLRNQRSE